MIIALAPCEDELFASEKGSVVRRVHARAGEKLAERVGVIGYLARELAAEVPALMAALSDA